VRLAAAMDEKDTQLPLADRKNDDEDGDSHGGMVANEEVETRMASRQNVGLKACASGAKRRPEAGVPFKPTHRHRLFPRTNR
jgi:hypothetical protein